MDIFTVIALDELCDGDALQRMSSRVSARMRGEWADTSPAMRRAVRRAVQEESRRARARVEVQSDNTTVIILA